MSQAAHIIRFATRPDTTDKLMEVFARAGKYILDDPTTTGWFVGRSESDPTTVVLAHAFDSEESRAAHFEGPAATMILAEAEPLLAAAPEIQDVSVVARG